VKCEKEEYLRDLLEKNKDKRIAIIVPKTYYVTVMTKCGYYDIMDNKHFLTIINANSFDNSVAEKPLWNFIKPVRMWNS
jgi:predicted nucleic-acid-binding Zn-ribbon protein